MTFANLSPFSDRAFGLLSSLAIHAAVGVALIAWPATGQRGEHAPRKSGEALMVVELIPLSGEGTDTRNSKGNAEPMLHEPAGSSPSISGDVSRMPTGHAPSPTVTRGGSAATTGEQDDTAEQAASGGAQALSGADMQQFRTLLLRHIERFRRYPDDARQAGFEGTVKVHFEMDRQGQVIDLWIEMSSGSRSLDNEALAAVLRARPLPLLPATWPSPMGVTLPISYALK
ncbi:energy transducer TonB family protein [Sphingopyxis sp. R3-92]|uniref:energy transducer TonB family protein n=1 Tax=Sphingopyxis sp. R3-92 TaxID=3158553 RepID=UPI003EE5F7A5